MNVDPATSWGAILRYLIVMGGTALGVASEEVLVQAAAALVALVTAVLGILKTRAAERA